MRYEKLYHSFKERIPEGKEFYRRMEEENLVDETDGQYVSFGMVIVPFIREVMYDKEQYLIQKVFSFLEEMALSVDSRIKDVLAYAVLEQLLDDDEDMLALCAPYMGDETIKQCMNVEKLYQI